jgi:hypothetical protein
MRRIHLFEFEDQKWFPEFLRNYMTDFLQFLSNKTKLYNPVIPIIEKGLLACQTNNIIDLASGGGGGLIGLNKELSERNPELKILLTDYYPNINAFEYTKKKAANFDFIAESVDAQNVPQHLKGLRTQFLSLHHFKPDGAKRILQNAVDSRNGITVFEAQERTFASLFAMFLSPVSVFLTTPFIRPFSMGRLVFTYLIPLVPLAVWWDGIVSSLRTYSVSEMNELISGLKNSETFDWQTGRIKSGPGTVLYLLGTPKNN